MKALLTELGVLCPVTGAVNINEGGRGFTLFLSRRLGVYRVYIAGLVICHIRR